MSLRHFQTALLIVPMALAGQSRSPRQYTSFPLPSGMKELAGSIRTFQAHAEMLSAIRHQYRCNTCPDVHAVYVSLGALGGGAIMSEASPINCGATGNCSIQVMFYNRGRYQVSELHAGWAYAIVRDGQPVPSIVIEQNTSYDSALVLKYSFADGKFMQTGCEQVHRKQDDSDILDPKAVTVVPC